MNINEFNSQTRILENIEDKGNFPLYCFQASGAGVGKSTMNSALYQTITWYYTTIISDCPDDIRPVLYAPTDKASHNIGGHTINFYSDTSKSKLEMQTIRCTATRYFLQTISISKNDINR